MSFLVVIVELGMERSVQVCWVLVLLHGYDAWYLVEDLSTGLHGGDVDGRDDDSFLLVI